MRRKVSPGVTLPALCQARSINIEFNNSDEGKAMETGPRTYRLPAQRHLPGTLEGAVTSVSVTEKRHSHVCTTAHREDCLRYEEWQRSRAGNICLPVAAYLLRAPCPQNDFFLHAKHAFILPRHGDMRLLMRLI